MANLLPKLSGFDAGDMLLSKTYSVSPARQHVLKKAQDGERFVKLASARPPKNVYALTQRVVQRAKPMYAKETHEHIFG